MQLSSAPSVTQLLETTVKLVGSDSAPKLMSVMPGWPGRVMVTMAHAAELPVETVPQSEGLGVADMLAAPPANAAAEPKIATAIARSLNLFMMVVRSIYWQQWGPAGMAPVQEGTPTTPYLALNAVHVARSAAVVKAKPPADVQASFPLLICAFK